MADKPEDRGTEHASEPVRPTRKGKSAAIDLPPSAVSEIRDEAPAESAPSEAAPSVEPPPQEAPAEHAARKPRLAMNGLIGLIAGAIGGFGAYHLGDFAKPKSQPGDAAMVTRLGALEKALAAKPADTASQGLVEKIAALETRLIEAQKRENEMRAALSKLATDLSGEASERQKALEALEALATRPASNGGAASPQNPAEIEALKKSLGNLGSKVDAAQPRIDGLAREVDTLSGRVAGLSQRDALGAANARMAAVQLTTETMARGRPLAEVLELLGRLGVEPAKLTALAPFAQAPVPGHETLLAELRAIKPQAAIAPKGDQGILDRVKSGAAALVEVRRSGEVAGSDDEALVAQVDQALLRRDIPTAAAVLARLSPARAGQFAVLRARAESAVTAGAALQALRADAFDALAKAAQTK